MNNYLSFRMHLIVQSWATHTFASSSETPESFRRAMVRRCFISAQGKVRTRTHTNYENMQPHSSTFVKSNRMPCTVVPKLTRSLSLLASRWVIFIGPIYRCAAVQTVQRVHFNCTCWGVCHRKDILSCVKGVQVCELISARHLKEDPESCRWTQQFQDSLISEGIKNRAIDARGSHWD